MSATKKKKTRHFSIILLLNSIGYSMGYLKTLSPPFFFIPMENITKFCKIISISLFFLWISPLKLRGKKSFFFFTTKLTHKINNKGRWFFVYSTWFKVNIKEHVLSFFFVRGWEKYLTIKRTENIKQSILLFWLSKCPLCLVFKQYTMLIYYCC